MAMTFLIFKPPCAKHPLRPTIIADRFAEGARLAGLPE
jgi:hypothetical protein